MASIEKRISSLTGKVSFRVRYRTTSGAARSETFDRERDAKAFRNKVELSKSSGTFVDPRSGDVTVDAWCLTWLDSKIDLKPSTADRYLTAINAQVVPWWAGVKLSRVRHEDVQAWVVQMASTLKPATARKAYRVLSQALDFAVKSGRLPTNHAKGIALPRIAVAEKRYLTHAQVDQLAALTGPAWQLAVYVLAYTGLRFGELAALRVKRVDVLHRRITVAESVTPVRGVMVWGTPKSHESRKIAIPRFLVDALGDQIKGLGPDDLVFTGPRGAVLRASTFRRLALTPAAEAMGLCDPRLDDAGRPVWVGSGADRRQVFTKHFHPHEFRHTAASLAIAAGADVKVVQQMLGHKSATMTLDLYGHLFPDRLDVVADAMETARKLELAGA